MVSQKTLVYSLSLLMTSSPLFLSLFTGVSWKSWKTIGFSPALARKAEILFLGLIIVNSSVR